MIYMYLKFISQTKPPCNTVPCELALTVCIVLFDLCRAGETLHSCPYFAVWSLDPVVEMVSPRPLLDVVVHDRSLSRGLPCTWPPPEQFFNPTTYNFGRLRMKET